MPTPPRCSAQRHEPHSEEQTPLALPPLALVLKPDKGKPCKLLLGGGGFAARGRWSLSVGDIFCVGLTHVRVATASCESERRHGAYRLVDDDGTRYRRREAKEERRAQKLRDDAITEAASTAAEDESHDVQMALAEEVGAGSPGAARAAPGGAGQHGSSLLHRRLDSDGGECGTLLAAAEMKVDRDAGSWVASTEAAPAPAPAAVQEESSDDDGDDDDRLAYPDGYHGASDDDEGSEGGHSESWAAGEEEAAGALSEEPLLRLELVAGPMRGQVLEVGREGASIGTCVHASLRLDADLTVSPAHACVVHSAGRWHLADLGSADGTFLLLADRGIALDVGDRVRLGKTDLSFSMRCRPLESVDDFLECCDCSACCRAVCPRCCREDPHARLAQAAAAAAARELRTAELLDDDVWARMSAEELCAHAEALAVAAARERRARDHPNKIIAFLMAQPYAVLTLAALVLLFGLVLMLCILMCAFCHVEGHNATVSKLGPGSLGDLGGASIGGVVHLTYEDLDFDLYGTVRL